MTEDTWTAEGASRGVGAGRVQYLRGTHHHEGAHEVDLGEAGTLRVLPDGKTTTRGRSLTITTALNRDGLEKHRMAMLVGALVVFGACNLYLNDRPLIATQVTGNGKWRIDLAETGEVRATWIGGGS